MFFGHSFVVVILVECTSNSFVLDRIFQPGSFSSPRVITGLLVASLVNILLGQPVLGGHPCFSWSAFGLSSFYVQMMD